MSKTKLARLAKIISMIEAGKFDPEISLIYDDYDENTGSDPDLISVGLDFNRDIVYIETKPNKTSIKTALVNESKRFDDDYIDPNDSKRFGKASSYRSEFTNNFVAKTGLNFDDFTGISIIDLLDYLCDYYGVDPETLNHRGKYVYIETDPYDPNTIIYSLENI